MCGVFYFFGWGGFAQGHLYPISARFPKKRRVERGGVGALLLSELATVLEGWGIHMVFSRAHPVCGCVDCAARPISLYLLRMCPDRIYCCSLLFSFCRFFAFFFWRDYYADTSVAKINDDISSLYLSYIYLLRSSLILNLNKFKYTAVTIFATQFKMTTDARSYSMQPEIVF